MNGSDVGLRWRRLLCVGVGFSLLQFSLAPANSEPVPDFLLPDVNDTSPRFGDDISPRNYLHQVTAYYFGDPG